MKKIILITDSTGMPRSEIPYEDTWIYRLKESVPEIDIMDRSARGSTTDRLATEGGRGVDLLETYMPHAAIIQLGMNDCAPRLFKRRGFEFSAINRFMTSTIRGRYIEFIKRTRGRNPAFTEVPPERFIRNLENFIDRAEAIKCIVVLIKIMDANSFILAKSPRAGDNIKLYNTIIDQLASRKNNVIIIAPLSECAIDSLCIDEVHLNIQGHNAVLDQTISALSDAGIFFSSRQQILQASSEELV